MKYKLLFILCVFTILSGCNSSDDEGSDVIYNKPVTDSPSATPAPSNEDSIATTIINRPSLWTVEFEKNSKEEKLKEPTDTALKTFSSTQIIEALNNNYPEVQLHLTKFSHDTIYVSIPESNKLTQQMGSTGAYNYMASAVYNLTEPGKIKYVKFDFEEGDHAAPGVFSRDDFKELR